MKKTGLPGLFPLLIACMLLFHLPYSLVAQNADKIA
jgi:hypothetical protein